jgi:addiction module RelE/StbE family toxin
MQLRWTVDAVSDLAAIRDYIEADNPEAARKTAARILAQAETLLLHPAIGRVGRVLNTRESVLSDLPYIIIYRVKDDQLEILRVLHTSRKYP